MGTVGEMVVGAGVGLVGQFGLGCRCRVAGTLGITCWTGAAPGTRPMGHIDLVGCPVSSTPRAYFACFFSAF